MTEARVGPYSILRLVRQGGQGRVYLGYDRRLQRQVAIKLHALPRGRAAHRRALAEARRASAINDPRVVQIYDVIESTGHLAIVMEYVPGCDLEELLRHARLGVASVLRVGADLAAALAAATLERVRHGDLTAANVLVTRDGRAKLTDFGIARQLDSRDEAVAGTPAAMTPEHLLGGPLDLRSDLFALGCLLYRMLTGEHPFYRGGQLDTQRLLHAEPRPVEEVAPGRDPLPADLTLLLRELLQKEPARRPQSTHRVRGLLRGAMREVPLVRADSLALEARPWFRPESSGDIPVQLPSDLRRRGRSRLVRRGAELWLQRFSSLRLSTRVTIAAVVPLCLAVAVGLALERTPVRVHFEEPDFDVSRLAAVPAGLDDRWVMEAVRGAVESRLGPMQASGAVRSRVYYAQVAGREPEEVVGTSLRCSEVLCVLLVTRRNAAGYSYRQALIPPQLPLPAWEEVLARNTASLFP